MSSRSLAALQRSTDYHNHYHYLYKLLGSRDNTVFHGVHHEKRKSWNVSDLFSSLQQNVSYSLQEHVSLTDTFFENGELSCPRAHRRGEVSEHTQRHVNYQRAKPPFEWNLRHPSTLILTIILHSVTDRPRGMSSFGKVYKVTFFSWTWCELDHYFNLLFEFTMTLIAVCGM